GLLDRTSRSGHLVLLVHGPAGLLSAGSDHVVDDCILGSVVVAAIGRSPHPPTSACLKSRRAIPKASDSRGPGIARSPHLPAPTPASSRQAATDRLGAVFHWAMDTESGADGQLAAAL